ncbi:MAG: DUF3046 domain-containing protein [Actinobacteria bacterium]|uniref:Unannotated protein n=1 Tax=freshwater metagenome TaxID=449393 RepID=A0A6J7FJH2_9ZZZZ|nr:DUF3046 domain-containing protein [Actinomycetota bacterium]
MRRSEFWFAVGREFGDTYGGILAKDMVIAELGDTTAAEALARGMSPRTVWLALCRAAEVPPERWHGAGLPEPKRDVT